ncbi:cytochrome oxidase small assembly protein [Undibacterium cyanobacteriorum]|uniref:Cytochrome oxidase small assembly protein n=1 Tax=Undibacterium cyanobacteriorum TaxID=3073561 RepID=A0ABY9RGL9_9BURK|nr:cytochrome oxidase small assembly protein [Undibacterium sp. 20NA77.5]WMW80363.1 cytochrome oxidase small assembly protein [Undibacterium sp. 20NA77.5]
MSNDRKPNNLRTALILASVAIVFFVGVIIKQTFLLGK